jgi:type I restriction enzyme R subunit
MTSVLQTAVHRPVFVPFDEQKAVRIYQRILPHWRQDGCTYFVTFRLNDSIPDNVKKEWEYEQQAWLAARGIHYDGPRGKWRGALERLSYDEQFRFRQHFNRQVQNCLDRGLGHCWLRRSECVAIARRLMLLDDVTQHQCGDFIVMPNHIHWLLVPSRTELELVLKRVKAASAVEINRLLDRRGTLWQAESYDHIVRDLRQLHAYREYIADNPNRANIAVSECAYYRATWMDEWYK